MSQEITFILEPDNGKITAEVSGVSTDVLTDLRDDLGTSQNVNCGKQNKGGAVKMSASENPGSDRTQSIWIYRIYHNSVVDGPGRRSVIQVSGCSIGCPDCYVPETHRIQNGSLFTISSVVEEIVENCNEQDGVTILGGEPFDQTGAVAELVHRLKRLGMHITIYSGNTIETLVERFDPNVHYILTHIDLLIDGPFIHRFAENAGGYKGSRNQRLIYSKDRSETCLSVNQN
ncbi:MAG: radical SAM protein [Acidobacteria bacterium]|nr:radical SAM protein [Acidobacteriota bacterium]